MPFSIHTGLKVSPFELHPGRKPRTELTNIMKGSKSYPSDWKTMNVAVPPKEIPIYVARNKKGEVADYIIMARKRKIPCCSSHNSPKGTPMRTVSGNFQYPYTFSQKSNQKKSLEGKSNEQPKIAIDGTEQTVRTTDNKILHRKLISRPLKFQKSPKKDISPKKHTLRRPGREYMSASENAKKAKEEGTISTAKPKVRKVESDEDKSGFEGYNKSDDNPVHVDIDKEVTEADRHWQYYQTNQKKKT